MLAERADYEFEYWVSCKFSADEIVNDDESIVQWTGRTGINSCCRYCEENLRKIKKIAREKDTRFD